CGRANLTRIGLPPQLIALFSLFQVSRHLLLIGSRDEELLGVGSAIPQLIGFGGVLRRESRISNIAVGASQERVGRREFRIDLDGALEKGNGARRARGGLNLPARAISL